MSRLAVGVDIIEIKRIQEAIAELKGSFLSRVFTKAELEDSNANVSSLAGRFAAKEAVMKALGTGATGVRWLDIEIITDTAGAPVVSLYGGAHEKSLERGIQDFSISISHCETYAVAVALGNPANG